MALRYYLVPKILAPSAVGASAYRPAYLYEDAPNVAWQGVDYGQEPVYLLVANVSNPQHAALVAHADVSAFPANLDLVVGANLAATQAALEAKSIPGDWVTAGMTFRAVLRWTARLFCIAQRLEGQSGMRLLTEQTLDHLVGDLAPARRQALADAAQSLGLDTSGITLGMTIRHALKILGNQVQLPIRLGGAL